MSKRARMGELAQILLDNDQRNEAPAAPAAVLSVAPEPEKKTGLQKPRKQVFGKPALRKVPKQQETLADSVEVHRAYGDRGDFEKVTVTLPADVRALLLDESLRRKKDRSPDWPIAAIVREAIHSYLGRKQ